MLTMLAGASATPTLRSQQQCNGTTPTAGFAGKIGRTAEDSTPSRLPETLPRDGAPNILYIVLDDTGFS
ncbi:MAG: hypothetical protein LC114_05290, partial [Bryobacterales bacterium]|nr:hypothetical protein [Bryobacterales bacterium]